MPPYVGHCRIVWRSSRCFSTKVATSIQFNITTTTFLTGIGTISWPWELHSTRLPRTVGSTLWSFFWTTVRILSCVTQRAPFQSTMRRTKATPRLSTFSSLTASRGRKWLRLFKSGAVFLASGTVLINACNQRNGTQVLCCSVPTEQVPLFGRNHYWNRRWENMAAFNVGLWGVSVELGCQYSVIAE